MIEVRTELCHLEEHRTHDCIHIEVLEEWGDFYDLHFEREEVSYLINKLTLFCSTRQETKP